MANLMEVKVDSRVEVRYCKDGKRRMMICEPEQVQAAIEHLLKDGWEPDPAGAKAYELRHTPGDYLEKRWVASGRRLRAGFRDGFRDWYPVDEHGRRIEDKKD